MVPFNGAILWHVCTWHKQSVVNSLMVSYRAAQQNEDDIAFAVRKPVTTALNVSTEVTPALVHSRYYRQRQLSFLLFRF